jgi:glycosyltransferase involved in cell wall biosynthesis
MRYAWDWHAEFGEVRGFHKNWLTSWIFEQGMHKTRLWDAISAKRVDVWIANAVTVQNRIKKYYRADAEVINPPVDTDYFDPSQLVTIPERKHQALMVSRISLSKGIEQGIRACHAAGMPLRIAGRGDSAPFEQLAKTLGADAVFLGPISDEEKRVELAEAACFLFPAEDDFGIAPVEAMAMGTPVVGLGKGGLTETVVDGKTGILYTEPTDEALTAALQSLDHHSFDPVIIRTQALKFSTEHFRTAITNLVKKHA